MEIYQNLNGDSGVTYHEIGIDSIKVEFRDSSLYLYNYTSPGQMAVEEMKKMAIVGRALNSYISKYVKKNYAAMLR